MTTVIVPRELLVRVDSVCSLVGYRYPTNIPADVVEDLRDLSQEARELYSSLLFGGMQMTLDEKVCAWPDCEHKAITFRWYPPLAEFIPICSTHLRKGDAEWRHQLQ